MEFRVIKRSGNAVKLGVPDTHEDDVIAVIFLQLGDYGDPAYGCPEPDDVFHDESILPDITGPVTSGKQGDILSLPE